MYHELSKSEKKLARILIEKGVDTEFRIALEETDKILSEWKVSCLDNRTVYQKLFKKIHERNKRIANRYDGLSGSRYLFTVALIYADGQITEEDIKKISEKNRAVLNNWLRLTNEES